VDLRRLSRGEWIAAISGVVLLVSLFLPWYTAGGHSATAWESMTVDDVLLAVAGLGGLAAAVAGAARPGTATPVTYIVLAGLGGILAAILALWRVLDPAPPVDVGLGAGAWLGLAAAFGLAAGAFAGARDEGPARRSEAASRAAAEEGLRRSELLSLSAQRGIGA
jgi:hypothetical protein